MSRKKLAIVTLCDQAGEEVITEKIADKNSLDKSLITPIPEATMIRLQNELVSKLECLFVFVETARIIRASVICVARRRFARQATRARVIKGHCGGRRLFRYLQRWLGELKILH